MEEKDKNIKERPGILWSTYIKPYIQPAFLICVAILAIAGSGMSIAIKSLDIYLKKEFLPLRKPLSLLDEKGLAPYEVVSKEEIGSEDVVEGLGADDYIQWILEDPCAPADSSVRYCSLFITYYGLPSNVVHIPEECYMGGGFQRLGADSIKLEIGERKIPVKYLIFAGSDSDYLQGSSKFPVLYFFKVNEDYVNSRGDARFILNKNIRGKHSYFCKVEWKFFSMGFGGRGPRAYPDREEAVTASRRLLSAILPILEEEHWPIWEKAGEAGGG